MVTVLTIDGMISVHCTRAVFTALALVEGVTRAEVEIGRAVIEHDGRPSAEQIQAALDLIGYRLVAASPGARRLPMIEGEG